MRIKYIIIDGIKPRLFSDAETHKELARGQVVTSAGFCDFHQTQDRDPLGDNYRQFNWVVSCYGKSESLGIASNPINDAAIIKRMLDS